jgi:hypothetical protein
MRSFFAEHPIAAQKKPQKKKRIKPPQDVQCEEAMLEAFRT